MWPHIGIRSPSRNRDACQRHLAIVLSNAARRHRVPRLAARPVEDEHLPDDIHARYEFHATLIDTIAGRDLRAVDLIREHNTS
jgi:hypothetical protein